MGIFGPEEEEGAANRRREILSWSPIKKKVFPNREDKKRRKEFSGKREKKRVVLRRGRGHAGGRIICREKGKFQ